MLTNEQVVALEKGGAALATMRLSECANAGPDTPIAGFQCGPVLKKDLEDWLAAKSKDEKAQQSAILRWAVIAGIAGLASVILTLVGILIPFMLKK